MRGQYSLALLTFGGLACASPDLAGDPAGRLAQPLSGPVVVDTTEAVGPFVGFQADPHPLNQGPSTVEPIKFAGTDLGFSYRQGDQIWFLFGDTWGSATLLGAEFIDEEHDDTLGIVTELDPSAIGSSNIPPVFVPQAENGDAHGIDPGHRMDVGKTPLGGWSNGTEHYGVFFLQRPTACDEDSDCSSVTGGLECDTDLGWWSDGPDGQPWLEKGLTFFCLDDGPGGSCNDETGQAGEGGFCVDKGTTAYPPSPPGVPDSARLNAVAYRLRIALRNADVFTPHLYDGDHVDWVTTKFFNSAYTTVEKFVPANGAYDPNTGNQNYNVADGAGNDERVLIWGRPAFVGVNKQNRNLGLYFAYVDMPSGNNLDWGVHYFTEVNESGVPQFSANEADANPVDLSSNTPGKPSSWEDHDGVGQMSIVWVDHLDKWVMFYGGGAATYPFLGYDCGLLELFTGECEPTVDLEGGTIFMRTADNPWGPWSETETVLVGGDPTVVVPTEEQYAEFGIMYHPWCGYPAWFDPDCQAFSPGSDFFNPGYLYAPLIVEPWIHDVDAHKVDLFWTVSTWNPYRLTLMKTTISQE